MQHELSAEEARLTYLLFPHRRGLELDHVEDRGDLVRLVACTRTPPVTCPECGEPATRVHDRYWRRHQDLSWCGRPVQAVLQVRRFICDNPACVVATFAEQVATPRSTSMAGTDHQLTTHHRTPAATNRLTQDPVPGAPSSTARRRWPLSSHDRPPTLSRHRRLRR